MILKPDYNVVSLFDIDFKKIKSQGIKAVLFDLDSTVMPSKSGAYPEKIKELLDDLKQNFVIAVISNNKNQEYINKVRKIKINEFLDFIYSDSRRRGKIFVFGLTDFGNPKSIYDYEPKKDCLMEFMQS